MAKRQLCQPGRAVTVLARMAEMLDIAILMGRSNQKGDRRRPDGGSLAKDSERQVHARREMYYQAIAEYHRRLAELERAVGGSLPETMDAGWRLREDHDGP